MSLMMPARTTLSAMLLTLSLGLAASPTLAQEYPTGQLFTADHGSGALTLIDLDQRATTALAFSLSPSTVRMAGGTSVLMSVGQVLTEEASKEGGGELHLLSTSDPGTLIAQIPVGEQPAFVVSDAAGERAFVTNAGDNTLSVIDLVTLQPVATVPTGEYPHGLALSPDERVLFVANLQENALSVIDTESLTEVDRISVGHAPTQITFTPNGSEAYVAMRDANAVAVVDVEARRVVDVVQVGTAPAQLEATADGKYVVVANEGNELTPEVRVSVIDTDRHQVMRTFEVGQGPHGIAVDDTGRFVFVTSRHASTLSVLDLEHEEVVDTYATGRDPRGVTWEGR